MPVNYQLPVLPLQRDFHSPEVLLALNGASRQLAELKGTAKTIPNERILTNTLILREARQSSAVENIITTQDELYRADIRLDGNVSSATKEVLRYADALRYGYDRTVEQDIITHGTILAVQERLEFNSAGIRKTPGVTLKNQQTGQVVYEPPQHPAEIERGLANLIDYLNAPQDDELDPLIRMAILHHQFESIHPFYDGNGRTGRILNILYLVKEHLLDLPILYLSGYIIRTKADYYRLLQAVRDEAAWDEWVVYMLNGIEETARDSIHLITDIRALMADYKRRIRNDHTRMYSQDLINNIFRQPYTRIDLLAQDLRVHENTARTYMNTLVHDGYLSKHKIGRTAYFVNDPLFGLLSRA
ncbi:Fic family protein [Neolewinella sp.]|uniref:Fic family protein n=1 Tax=Neolewinella sp. TaxID=2993543 RepID=UPI003B52E77B